MGLGLEDWSREEAVVYDVDGDTAEFERLRLSDMMSNQCQCKLF